MGRTKVDSPVKVVSENRSGDTVTIVLQSADARALRDLSATSTAREAAEKQLGTAVSVRDRSAVYPLLDGKSPASNQMSAADVKKLQFQREFVFMPKL